jgi:PAS domain S-box-containing protein
VNEEETPVPQDLLAHLSENSPILSSPGSQNFTSGIITLKQGPMLITAQPILTSENEGPARGTLIFARYLSTGVVSDLSQITLVPITIRPLDKLIYSDFREAFTALLQDEPIFIKTLNTQDIGGYTLLKDIYGKNALIMKVEIPRDIYQLGQSVTSYFILSILGVGLLVAAFAWLMIQTRLLSRITRLIHGINYIAESGDTSARISLGGSDEVSLVAGTVNGMLAALEDAGAEIQKRERRYRLLAENISDVIWTMDAFFKFTYVSPSVIHLTGYTAEEAMDITLEDYLDIDTFNAVKKAFSAIASQGDSSRRDAQSTRTFEIQLNTKDGSKVWTEIGISAIRDQDGKVTGFAGAARDVSERREASENLQLRYEEERALREQLEDEIRKRIEFTRALVHELKTPITPVLAATELLLEEISEERLTRLVESIDRSASNLNRRIDELLDLARGEVDMLHLNIEPVEPIPLIQEVGYEVIPVALRGGHTLNVDLPSSLPTIPADRERLRQIVHSLLNNAFKFTPKGGKITLRAKEEDANLVIEVSDTGSGISKEERERVFEPYFRRIADRDRLSGLGLGLALSKRLVELHGGQIWVRSRKGKGSTFGFSLPVKAVIRKEEQVNRSGEL